MKSFHCILEQQQSHRTAQLIRAVKRTWYVCDLWCFDTDSCLDLRRWRHHLETLTDSLCYRVVVVYSNDGQWRFRTFWRKLNCLQVTALRCDMHPNPLRENSPPDVTPCSGMGGTANQNGDPTLLAATRSYYKELKHDLGAHDPLTPVLKCAAIMHEGRVEQESLTLPWRVRLDHRCGVGRVVCLLCVREEAG
eukprot:CAMPEP_0181226482 /NCGR_PEP_ID=MMETSP1096-20121128/32281_1 /TAXON_ID=156174 ORGANISM="Chrysochromulina ericina, Strain CCMP281" /NCGR_SAMPLE_ID=MMETSP1096 /ASSEMBLY_ACC=CAM_ASM_000453 /LENGTH=192 /DNA_ID=CAMNT_0023319829 /DNA_START=181 /DNA_END=756 /DNA_ORIENTATION=-